MSMFDACICVDVDEGPSVFSQYVVTARKAHVCCECHETIKPGERYERFKGRYDGQWSAAFHTCLGCARVSSSLVVCGHEIGRLWDEVHIAYCSDRWDDDDVCICPGGDL